MKTPLKKRYRKIIDEYIKLFEEKQGIKADEYDKLNYNHGVIWFDDSYFFTISDIIIDIDENTEKGLIIKWFNESSESEVSILYYHYIKGLRFPDLKK